MSMIIEGKQYRISESSISVGDLIVNIIENNYSIVESICEETYTLTTKCSCGQCTLESRTVPIENCRKLVQFNPILN